MNIKKQFLIIGMIVIPMATGVIIRETGTYRFGHDARELAANSFESSHMISREKLAAMNEPALLIDLTSEGAVVQGTRVRTVHIPAAQLLGKASLDTLRNYADDTRILYSSNQGEAARAWMVLSQMGYRNLYILEDDRNEEMKYPFRPESATPAETDQ